MDRPKEITGTKKDFDDLYVYRAIVEKILDYKGIEEGTDIINKMFPSVKDWNKDIIKDYKDGVRMTEKTDEIDEGIKRICEGY